MVASGIWRIDSTLKVLLISHLLGMVWGGTVPLENVRNYYIDTLLACESIFCVLNRS